MITRVKVSKAITHHFIFLTFGHSALSHERESARTSKN